MNTRGLKGGMTLSHLSVLFLSKYFPWLKWVLYIRSQSSKSGLASFNNQLTEKRIQTSFIQ